jgi:hypothetical protein
MQRPRDVEAGREGSRYGDSGARCEAAAAEQTSAISFRIIYYDSLGIDRHARSMPIEFPRMFGTGLKALDSPVGFSQVFGGHVVEVDEQRRLFSAISIRYSRWLK